MSRFKNAMHYILRRTLPRRLQSGSFKYPTSIDVFNSLIDHLMKLDEQDKVYFTAKKCKGWAEVRLHRGGGFLVSIKFPYKDSLEAIVAEKGIKVPECWGVRYFKKRKKVTFWVGKKDRDTIEPFLDLVFKKLYGCLSNYTVIGKLSLGIWQIE